MKRLLYLVVLLISSKNSFAQKMIEDSSLKAHNERMVISNWGNFKPNPKYTLFGIQTNIHYTNVWGWIAPAQNRRYRKGKDIRPLGPIGEQTQRMMLLAQMKTASENHLAEAEVLGRTAESELLYNLGLISKLDPLWLLYYERKLKPVLIWNIGAINAIPVTSYKVQKYMNENGIFKWWSEEMDRLRQRLDGALDVNMERGSRILAYHRIMKDYQATEAILNQHIYWAETLLQIQGDSQSIKSGDLLKDTNWKGQSDSEIMRGVIKESLKY